MKCRFGFNLFFALCFAWLLVPFVSNAQAFNGYFNMYYVKSTNYGTIPQQYTSTIGFNFPTSTYTQIPGSTIVNGSTTAHQFSVITRADIQPTFNFVKGNQYTLTLHFDTGSYIYYWFPTNTHDDWFISSCTNNLCSGASTSYTYTTDSTHTGLNTLDLTIKFTASNNVSNPIISIGNLTDNRGILYNAYSVQQGIRITSTNIEVIEQSLDLSPIIDNQNQNTQTIINNNNQNTQSIINSQNATTNAITDINDTLTDSSVNDSNINDFFDDLEFYDNNNFSSLITSPINFLNSLNDSCTPINLQLFGKTVSLPCGTSVFWERDLPYISTFRVFWNVLFGGALIYTLGLLLVKNISDAIDPTKDNIGGFKI